MRAFVLLAAMSATAAADPLHDFVTRWPKLGDVLVQRHLDAALWQGAPCADLRDGSNDPPITDTTSAAVSPDGKRLALLATVDVDAPTAKALGIPRGLATLVIIANGSLAAVRAFAPQSFPRCVGGGTLEWSDDSARVYATLDTGHGIRIALVDTSTSKLVVDAFARGDTVTSPDLHHVAWQPWFSEWPDAEISETGGQLMIDARTVWGAGTRGTQIRDVSWTSETELELCGALPGKPFRRFRVRVGKPPVPAGDCNPI